MSPDLEPSNNSGNEPRRLRATDAQRQHTAELLSLAFSTGQLSLMEFDERTALAFNAVYTTDLEPLIADLSIAAAEAPVAHPAPPVPLRQRSAFSLSILGSSRMEHWLVPAFHTSIAILGDNRLDLRSAKFQSTDTTIVCFGVLSDIEIIAPPNIEVIAQGVGVLGDFVTKSYYRPENPTHRVRVTGLALLSEVEVTCSKPA